MNFQTLFSEIVNTFNTPQPSESEIYEEKKYESYPFDRARKGHNQAIEKILDSDFAFLSSPTGTGKTAIELTAICESDLPSILIVPRNALQVDIVENYKTPKKLIPLLGKRKLCEHWLNEKTILCDLRVKENGKSYIRFKGKLLDYPCEDCPYHLYYKLIEDGLSDNTCIPILNQGNFYLFKDDAKFVVVDEADSTFAAIKDAISYPEPYSAEDPIGVLDWMASKYDAKIEEIEERLEKHEVLNDEEVIRLNRAWSKIKSKKWKIGLFRSKYSDKLITYVRKETTFVEVFEDNVEVLAKRLFPDAEKILLVSATPPLEHKDRTINFTLPFPRVRVFCSFVGNLSVTNVNKENGILEKAVDAIIKIHDFVSKLTGVGKSVIHCGNLNLHGKRVSEILEENNLKPLLMTEGQQAKAIEEFRRGDYDFLCVVAAEHGMDWKEFPEQYILKVPFADLGDPRISAIRGLMMRKYGKSEGPRKFSTWYDWDAMSRVIQACGRNTRRPEAFACSFILDNTFKRLYERFEPYIPDWFRRRLVWFPDLDQSLNQAQN